MDLPGVLPLPGWDLPWHRSGMPSHIGPRQLSWLNSNVDRILSKAGSGVSQCELVRGSSKGSPGRSVSGSRSSRPLPTDSVAVLACCTRWHGQRRFERLFRLLFASATWPGEGGGSGHRGSAATSPGTSRVPRRSAPRRYRPGRWATYILRARSMIWSVSPPPPIRPWVSSSSRADRSPARSLSDACRSTRGEAHCLGELDVTESAGQEHHGAAALDRGELLLVPGDDHLAAARGGVADDVG